MQSHYRQRFSNLSWNSCQNTRQWNNIPSLQATVLGLYWRVTRVPIHSQFGEGNQMGATLVLGFPAWEICPMVGTSKESRLQATAFVSRRRFQAGREHILGQWLGVEAQWCSECLVRGRKILRLCNQLVPGGTDVRPLHPNCLEEYPTNWLRSSGLRHWRCVHDLQLWSAG